MAVGQFAAGNSPAWIFPVICLLISGSCSAIANKILYEYRSLGSPDCSFHSTAREFAKPYFLTLTMFLGEAMCLLVHYYNKSHIGKSITKWLNSCSSENNQINYAAQHSKSQETYQYGNDSPRESDGLINHFSSSTITPRLNSVKFSYDSDSELDLHKTAKPSPPQYYYLFFSVFDLAATAIGGIGLIYISASVNQMFRGSMVLFTAVFARIFLNSQLHLKQFLGIGFVVLGLSSVGLSSQLRALDNDGEVAEVRGGLVFTAQDQAFGICLVLLGSAFNSLQNVLEEKLLKTDLYETPDALEVVGWEGVWGSVICLFLLPILSYLPGEDCGSMENLPDTLLQIKHSHVNLALNLLYMFSIGILNNAAVAISGILSATHRQIAQSIKTILVWNFQILIVYAFTHHHSGEAIDLYSLIQVGGFFLLLMGTFLYGVESSAPHTLALQSLSNSHEQSLANSPHRTKYGSTEDDGSRSSSVSALLNELHNKPLRYVAFLTSSNASANDYEYLNAVLLIENNFVVENIVWTSACENEAFDWTKFSAVIVRSTWDYHENYEKFLQCICSISKQTLVVNTPAVMQWNSNKFYLRQFETLKIHTLDTIFLPQAAEIQTKQQLLLLLEADRRFKDVATIVIKPAISAGAHKTVKLRVSALKENKSSANHGADNITQQLLSYSTGESVLIQPFCPEIQISGELSFVFFNYEFSHCVHKQPAANDFRVQEQFGGSRALIQPNLALIQQAQSILIRSTKHFPEVDLLYARVDCIVRNSLLYVMELELIEPSLYWESLQANPKALTKATKLFAHQLYQIINKHQHRNRK
jgi:drug/metabolite transporter (DMT)-like permease